MIFVTNFLKFYRVVGGVVLDCRFGARFDVRFDVRLGVRFVERFVGRFVERFVERFVGLLAVYVGRTGSLVKTVVCI